MAKAEASEPSDFSLLSEGPFSGLINRARMTAAPYRLSVVAVIFTSLPLLGLSAMQGLAAPGAVTVPLVEDLPVIVRFLLVLPVLIFAETFIGSKTAKAAKHFFEAGIVERDYRGYLNALREVTWMRRSAWPEIIIAVLIVLETIFVRPMFDTSGTSWEYISGTSGPVRTWAGWWYILVCMPIYQFFVFRWVWRYFLWCRFNWRVSRLDLRLLPAHPDRMGGLEFLSIAQARFGIIVFAFGSAVSAYIGSDVVFAGADLEEYVLLIVMFVVAVAVIFLGPMALFSAKLMAAKDQAVFDYGRFASDYTNQFHRKWVSRETYRSEPLLGNQDLSVLADLQISFTTILNMRQIPIDIKEAVLPILLSAAAPLLPLALAIAPLSQLIRMVIAALLAK